MKYVAKETYIDITPVDLLFFSFEQFSAEGISQIGFAFLTEANFYQRK